MGRNAIAIAVGLTLVAVALALTMGRVDMAASEAAPRPGSPRPGSPRPGSPQPGSPPTPTATKAAASAAEARPALAVPAAPTAVEAPAAGHGAHAVVAPIVAPRFGPIHGDPVDPAKLDADAVHLQAVATLIAPEAAKVFERCLGGAGGALQPMSFRLELKKVAATAAGGRPQVALTSIQPSAGLVGNESDASPTWQRCSTELRDVRVELPRVHDEAPDHGFITAMIQVPESFAVRLAAASVGAKAQSEVAK